MRRTTGLALAGLLLAGAAHAQTPKVIAEAGAFMTRPLEPARHFR